MDKLYTYTQYIHIYIYMFLFRVQVDFLQQLLRMYDEQVCVSIVYCQFSSRGGRSLYVSAARLM